MSINNESPKVGQVWQKPDYGRGMFYRKIVKITDTMIFYRQCSADGEVFWQKSVNTFRCKIENASLNLGVLTNI